MAKHEHEHADTSPAKHVTTKPFAGAGPDPKPDHPHNPDAPDPDDAPSEPVKAKHEHEKPLSFTQCCDKLSADLDLAAGSADPAKIEACWARMDELTIHPRRNPSDQAHYAALSARFAHFAPRKLDRVHEIEAALDAGLSDKTPVVKAKVEAPAVTAAKAALAALKAEQVGTIVLPADAAAIEALEAKIAAVPLQDAD